MRMKRSGRTSIVVIAAVAIVAAVVLLFLMAGDSPSAAANRFLVALAKGDTKAIAENSYMEGLQTPEIEKAWQDTYDVSKYWVFAYHIQETEEQDPNNATVRLAWVKGADSQAAYEEKYELPMVKRDGKWKVDVRGISREMYPSLPR